MLIQGKAKWAKVFKLADGYEGKFKHWTLDVYIDEKTETRLANEGLKPKIKESKEGEKFITFSRKEFKTDGSANPPIRIIGPDGKTPFEGKAIGNGSTVNINFAINDAGKFGKTANILSMQVFDLVEYEGGEFPVNEAAVKPSSSDENWAEDQA